MECEIKFSSLARFVAAQVTDDVFKVTRFEVGLLPNIRQALVALLIVSYFDIVMRSLAIAAKKLESKREGEANVPTNNVQIGSS